MTTYLIRSARVLGGEPADLLMRDGLIAEVSAPGSTAPRAPRPSTPTGWSPCPAWSTCTPTCASPAARTPRPSRPARMAAALGGFTAVHAMANTDPVADTAGVVEQVWRLGREAGHCDVFPVGAVTVGLGGRAARRARCDGRLGRAGAGLLRRRQVRLRPGADAPGPRVRQGLRRRGRPARPGAAADRGRPDERGRALRPARAAWLARRRRGGDHRPGLPAGRPRRVPAARLPRLHRRLGRDRPLGQEQGLGRHRRGVPAPPAADRRAGRDLRPDLQGQPAAARRRRRRGAAGRARRRHHRHRGHRPRPAPARGQGLRVAGGRVRDARAGDRAVDRAADDGRHRPARLGRRRGADVVHARPDRPARPGTDGRSPSASPPTSCSTTPRPAGSSTPPRRPRCRATRRTPDASCPAGWSRPSCAGSRPSWTASSHEPVHLAGRAGADRGRPAALRAHVAGLARPRPQARPPAARAAARRSRTSRRPGWRAGPATSAPPCPATGSTGWWPAGSAPAAPAG